MIPNDCIAPALGEEKNHRSFRDLSHDVVTYRSGEHISHARHKRTGESALRREKQRQQTGVIKRERVFGLEEAAAGQRRDVTTLAFVARTRFSRVQSPMQRSRRRYCSLEILSG
jgi:hypothetical protein